MERCWGVADDGGVVEIRHPDRARLEQVWPPIGLSLTSSPPRDVAHTYVVQTEVATDPEVTVDGTPAVGGWDRIESDLALFAADRLRGTIAIHAALVAVDDQGVLLPGPSHAGKSSLAMAAARAGLLVLSDEFALVDMATGLLTGWRRPVRVRHTDGNIARHDIVFDHDPVEVGLVALLNFTAGADRRWERMSAADAVVAILGNTVSARTRPDESFDVACRLARAAPAVVGTRGDADGTIDRLVALARQSSAPGETR